MASEFARMFLDRKRTEQGRSNGIETSPAPNPYQRYGLMGERPLQSGKFTGNGEDGVLDPTMPTERRVAVNGHPYAVDEGEVVVINAETVKAYGGPENLDRYIQSHRPDSNYQEMGPRDQGPVDPRIVRGAGQAPASMMNDQFSTGGVPSKNLRPYDSQYQILKDVQGGMPRMFLGGPSTKVTTTTTPIPVTPKIPDVAPPVQPIPDIVKPEQTMTPSGLPGTAQGSTLGGILRSAGENLLNYIDTGRDNKNLVPWPFIPNPKPLPTTTEQYQGPVPVIRVSGPERLPTATEQYQGPEMALHRTIDPNLYRTTSTALKGGIQDSAPAVPAPITNPPAGAPTLSPSKLDEMVLNNYLTRMGGMSESERAAEEQRLMQQGVSPEAIRGQVAMSDVSRRSAMGQAAEQFATGAAQRADTRAVQNRTFEETRRANMPNQMKTDAGSMSEASWISKYPNATHDDYMVASGQSVTPSTRFGLWSQAMTSLQSSPGVTQDQLDAQWNIAANDPTLAPYLSTMAKPNLGAIASQANPTIDSYADSLIRFGVGKDFSNSPTYQSDMRDFAESIITSGGTIDPKTGQFTFGKDPVSLPWNNPDKWYQYTDFDGKDIPDGVNASDPAWMSGTVVINGKPVVRSDLVKWWNDDATTTEKLNIINGTKTVGDYYGDGRGAKLPTDRANLDTWFSDNTEAQSAFDNFKESLGVEGKITVTGSDGKPYDITVGDQNLRWVWTQFVNEINGGDYSKPISQDNIKGDSYTISKDGTISKKKDIVIEDISSTTSLTGVNDSGQWRIKSGNSEVKGGQKIAVNNPAINGGAKTMLISLGNSTITERGINNMRYRFYDPSSGRFYYVDTSEKGSVVHEQTDPQTIQQWRTTYSEFI